MSYAQQKQPPAPAPRSTTIGQPTTQFSPAGQDTSRPEDYLAMDGWERNFLSQREGQNTTLDSLTEEERALLADLPEDTLLRLSFSPDDMNALALGAEQDALEAVTNTLTVNNASEGFINYLIDSGKFTDVILSGHGSPEGLYITGDDGLAQLLPNDQIASMFEGTMVEQVLVAACNSGDGIEQALNGQNISTYTFDNIVSDSDAIERVVEFGQSRDLSKIGEDADMLNDPNMDPSDRRLYNLAYSMSSQGNYSGAGVDANPGPETAPSAPVTAPSAPAAAPTSAPRPPAAPRIRRGGPTMI